MSHKHQVHISDLLVAYTKYSVLKLYPYQGHLQITFPIYDQNLQNRNIKVCYLSVFYNKHIPGIYVLKYP